MKPKKISIPHPCHQSWDNMTPAGDGKHCASCDKVVVDFTTMSLEEIQHYFEAHKSEKTCGHFKRDQVQVPIPFLHKKLMNAYAYFEKQAPLRFFKVASLSLITFFMTLVGCDNRHVEGEIAVSDDGNRVTKQEDTNCSSQDYLMGDTVVLPKKDTIYHIKGEIRRYDKEVPLIKDPTKKDSTNIETILGKGA